MRIDQALKSKRFLGAKLGSMETRQTWLAVLKAAYAIPLVGKRTSAIPQRGRRQRPPPTPARTRAMGKCGSPLPENAASPDAIGVFQCTHRASKAFEG